MRRSLVAFVLVILVGLVFTGCSGEAVSPVVGPTDIGPVRSANISQVTADLPDGTRLGPEQSINITSNFSIDPAHSTDMVTLYICVTQGTRELWGSVCVSRSRTAVDLGNQHTAQIRSDNIGAPERSMTHIITIIMKGVFPWRPIAGIPIPQLGDPDVIAWRADQRTIIFPAK